jgi:hypothetical protein
LQPALDEEPPAPGKILPIRFWMLHSTLRLCIRQSPSLSSGPSSYFSTTRSTIALGSATLVTHYQACVPS